MSIKITCPYCGSTKNNIYAQSLSIFNDAKEYDVYCSGCNCHFGLKTLRYAHAAAPLHDAQTFQDSNNKNLNSPKSFDDLIKKQDDEMTEAIHNLAANIFRSVGGHND